MDPLREATEPTDVQEIYGSDGTRTRDLRRHSTGDQDSPLSELPVWARYRAGVIPRWCLKRRVK